eukprot:13601-Heterococcus_DN1.PRE.2
MLCHKLAVQAAQSAREITVYCYCQENTAWNTQTLVIVVHAAVKKKALCTSAPQLVLRIAL